MKNTTPIFAAALLGLIAPCIVRADVKMPSIFGDHMVLQQEATLPVWGWAAPGEKVTVTVGTESASATAGTDGKWMVKLPPLPNGAPPTTMTVAGKNTITFTDVLVGEVWVCSGQSNMQYGMVFTTNCSNSTDAIYKADNPNIRLFLVPSVTSITPLDNCSGQWVACTPATLRAGGWAGFTAVGYFFGRELQMSLHRPVGLIESAWGGTPAQAWTSLSGLEKEPSLKGYVDAYNKNLANFNKLLAVDPNAATDYPAKAAAWQITRLKWQTDVGNPYQTAMKAWTAAEAQAKAAGQSEPPKPVASSPPPPVPQDPSGGPNGSSNLYNGMIAPLIPYAIKGVIWYQGESNSGLPIEYRTLFGRMITDWREKWGQGDFPFLYVQLASFYSGPVPNWAYLRESQLKTLALPNTGMASATDIGDFHDVYSLNYIHPHDKLDVGLRLALVAKHVAYGQNIVYSGPMYDSYQVEGGSIRVKFTQTGSGLVIGSPPWTDPTSPPWPTDKLVGFELAGVDGNYVPADARIDGNSVVVSSPQVTQPVYVRYGWGNQVLANLYNKEKLPASPFRTDNQPIPLPPKAPPPAPKPVAPAPVTNAAPTPPAPAPKSP